MAVELPSWQHDWATPPGEILQEVLEDRGLTQTELSRRMDRPLKTINEIVKAKAAITAETAIQLERALGVEARFWTNLEARYREHVARVAARGDLSGFADWARQFPVSKMRALGAITSGRKGEALVEELLTFFGVSSPKGWERLWEQPPAALRQSKAFAASPYALAAWLRWGQREAESLFLPPTDSDGFRALVPRLVGLTSRDLSAVIPILQDECAKCGVAVLMLPEFTGARVTGAVQWIGSGTAVIQLSGRYKTVEQFWMTFFHESAHVFEGGRRLGIIVDEGDDLEGLSERRAEEFAKNTLVPATVVNELLSKPLTRHSLCTSADQLGVAPDIVLGRLCREGTPWSSFADLRRPFDWAYVNSSKL